MEIDDRLPTSNGSRVLHVIDRSHPGLLWPALIEKAYLKVRGGYDFPGSNSGTDLCVITGWIPQQIFLHDEDVEALALWEELMPAFSQGDILLTLGTGKLSRHEQKHLGLGAEHDYAVLDMKETAGLREMLIKNPWSDGEIWKGAVRRRPNPGHEGDVEDTATSVVVDDKMVPGTFWMEFNSVFQHFENMYINWNPCSFNNRQDIHFSWSIPETAFVPNIFIQNPQFFVQSSKTGQVWLLLNRHFRTGDYTAANPQKGYISLYLFDRQGVRVLSSEGARIRGSFVDSPNTMIRFEAKANEAYTAVVVSQDLAAGKHNFTLSAFSKMSVSLGEAQDKYGPPKSMNSAWTRSTAGGNADSARYIQNPQFKISLATESCIAILLRLATNAPERIDKTDIHVKVLVALSDGGRVTKLRSRDIVAHSGDYRRGSAVIETLLPKGTYSIICSTFEQNQIAKFVLDTYASQQVLLVQLPSESSGRLSILSTPAIFNDGVRRLVAPLTVGRMTKVIFILSSIRGSGSSLFKFSLEQGQGPYRMVLATSSTEENEYGSIASGLRINDMDLNARMSSQEIGGLWLALERPGQPSNHSGESVVLQIEMLCEERIELGVWAPLED